MVGAWSLKRKVTIKSSVNARSVAEKWDAHKKTGGKSKRTNLCVTKCGGEGTLARRYLVARSQVRDECLKADTPAGGQLAATIKMDANH